MDEREKIECVCLSLGGVSLVVVVVKGWIDDDDGDMKVRGW